jgi:hypothetical protein
MSFPSPGSVQELLNVLFDGLQTRLSSLDRFDTHLFSDSRLTVQRLPGRCSVTSSSDGTPKFFHQFIHATGGGFENGRTFDVNENWIALMIPSTDAANPPGWHG